MQVFLPNKHFALTRRRAEDVGDSLVRLECVEVSPVRLPDARGGVSPPREERDTFVDGDAEASLCVDCRQELAKA